MSRHGIEPLLRHARALGFALALILCCETHAEWDLLKIRITRADFDRMLATTPFSREQQVAGIAVYESFARDFASAAAKLQARVDRMQGGTPGDTWGALNTDWMQMRLEFEDRLESDVAAALGNDGAAGTSWSHAVMAERRRRVLGEMASEQLVRKLSDLMQVLAPIRLSPAEREAVAPLIDGYEHDMDQGLHNWQREHIRLMRASNQRGDDEAANKRRGEAGVAWAKTNDAIRQISDDLAPRIAELLEPANRLAFLEGYGRAVCPEAFERCPAELALEAIRLTADVPREKRDAIEAIYADYAPQRDEVRRQIVAVVRKWDKGEYPLKREIEAFWEQAAREQMPPPERNKRSDELLAQHPANPLLERRHKIALDAVHRMRSVFSDDELAKLPLAVRLALTTW